MSDEELHITGSRLNFFLEFCRVPNKCAQCGSESNVIAADPHRSGFAHEFYFPISHPDSSGGMTYYALICDHCGYTRWFWKQRVLEWLEKHSSGTDNER